MEYVCAVTGALAEEEAPLTETGPLGWIKITIERQVPNPEYVQLQQLKESMVEQQFESVRSQIPEGDAQGAATVRMGIEFQIRAMFVALESDMDEYVSQYEEAYISTPEVDEDTREALNSIRDALGLLDDMGDDEDDGEEENDEPTPSLELVEHEETGET